ncbi:hypothetical protein UAW_01869 [Enterococcus haemoperoxidus ATCC BAA-382]|uniref:Uncharacterized protein n=1 Tax=Enterococcus haemoperoxidus ATCC BAA-382 TaxID=1158608 RepID=R2T8Y1_9ENTE|nr:hypothetical protein [Enterococcus haemoperoxidus]EOH96704.1 hypothetical protein UAW_01869 [Enterococcus haemoperoxidus ATCC BAA-382]EOT60200.1 hypothetical protein I583_02835 [Enterococcus haemoperoxidus ATCC BAA-382]OJG52630.1 hypothetical protein RV06_GL000938 [Enterococcus haemoperoxidus]
MEKVNLTKNTAGNKKVYLRKEIEANRLGEEIYSEDVLSQYSVYLLRKFEVTTDYEQPEQFEALLADLPEQFNHEFEDCVAKSLYVRVTQKAVYITLLLALAHPLSKLQISDLRTWISSLEVPELPLEHMSSLLEEVPLEMIKGLQETNSEVLLLTEMMNQFSENLNDIYKDVQAVKEKRTPPVVKVVQSKVAAKEALEFENAKQLKAANEKISQLMEEFSTFKTYVDDKLANMPKPKTPPKFKITFGPGEKAGPTVETRLEEAIKRIDLLGQRMTRSDEQVIELNKTIKENKPTPRPKLKFATAKETSNEQNKLADKLATTSEEVTTISQQLQQINDKLSAVESTVLEAKPDSEALARIEQDHGQLQETASETIKLNQVINQLTEKLQAVETELTTVKNEKKKVPTAKLTKSDSAKKLAEQHQKDQEQLKSNATEIKKLTQTVGKVDVQLIKAHQKIAELEQKMRQTAQSAPVVKKEPAVAVQQAPMTRSSNTMVGPAAPPTLPKEPQQKAATQASRNFPTKESFLQANRPVKSATEIEEERPTVTLAIEEMLDRVSEKHPQTNVTRSSWALEEGYDQNSRDSEDVQASSLRRLKKLEWDIHSFFQPGRGMGHKGMMPKDDFYANIRKIEVLPYLWASVYEREKKDILLGNELSSQQLINDLNDFLDEIAILSKKRKVMGKWIYCPKEVEQKMEGYKLLSEYLETYLARQSEG